MPETQRLVSMWIRVAQTTVVTSKTEKYLWDTKFSHYLGQKHNRNTEIEKFHAFFHPDQAVQSFTT